MISEDTMEIPDEKIADTPNRILKNQDRITLTHCYIAPIWKPNKNRLLPQRYWDIDLLVYSEYGENCYQW